MGKTHHTWPKPQSTQYNPFEKTCFTLRLSKSPHENKWSTAVVPLLLLVEIGPSPLKKKGSKNRGKDIWCPTFLKAQQCIVCFPTMMLV